MYMYPCLPSLQCWISCSYLRPWSILCYSFLVWLPVCLLLFELWNWILILAWPTKSTTRHWASYIKCTKCKQVCIYQLCLWLRDNWLVSSSFPYQMWDLFPKTNNLKQLKNNWHFNTKSAFHFSHAHCGGPAKISTAEVSTGRAQTRVEPCHCSRTKILLHLKKLVRHKMGRIFCKELFDVSLT